MHSIAIQVPKIASDARWLHARPASPDATRDDRRLVHGQPAEGAHAERQQMARTPRCGPWVQVSRLGHPLINEVIIPMGKKDYWNADAAQGRRGSSCAYCQHPELAGLLPVLYPKVFPNLAAYKAPRADLAAILMTGIPAGIVPGFQNFTGKTPADMLRLNMAIPPATKPNPAGRRGRRPRRLSRTAAASSTTCSPSSCAPSPA